MTFQESETVELKAIVVEDIKKEIIAFANCEGGKLYIGVQDDGTVSGLDDPDGTSLQVSNMVRDAIKPDLTMFLHYKTLTVDGKNLLVLCSSRWMMFMILLIFAIRPIRLLTNFAVSTGETTRSWLSGRLF